MFPHRPAGWLIIASVFLLNLCGSIASAQDNLQFDHLTVEKGLSHSTVYTILQDRLGFLWIGTRYGLNRYDGYSTRIYSPHDSTTAPIPGQAVLALWESPEGDLWVGHRSAGISILDRRTGQFRRYSDVAGAPGIDWPSLTVRRLFADSRGWLWIATTGQGVLVLDEQRRVRLHLHPAATQAGLRLSNDIAFDFAEDARGRIWIGTAGAGINVYDPATGEVEQVHQQGDDGRDLTSFSKSLYYAPDGDLWIGTEGSGLYRYATADHTFQHYTAAAGELSSDLITDLTPDGKGRLWITTDGGGLNLLDPATGRIRPHRYRADQPRGLNTDALYNAYVDQVGNVWIGTFNGGVNIWKAYQPPFQAYGEQAAAQAGLGFKSVLALAPAGANEVWIGTDGGGLSRFDPATGNLVRINPTGGLPTNVITSLEPDGNGGLWLGSFARGLTHFAPASGRITNYRHRPGDARSLAHDNVWDLLRTPDGTLWIATLGGGLDRLRPGSTVFEHYAPDANDPHSLPDVQVVDVLADRRGHIWVATESDGLHRLDPATGRFEHFRRRAGDPRSLSSDQIRCLYEDGQGQLWIGTEGGGINILQPGLGVIKRYTTREGLPSDLIDAIRADSSGMVWISTDLGLARLDPRSGQILSFYEADGLAGNQFNPRAALALADGRLLFGGINGFTMVDPRRVQINPHPPRVVLTDFKLFNQPVPEGHFRGRRIRTGGLNEPGAELHLSYRDNTITFEFAALDFANAGKNTYAYKLEGFDAGWNYTGADRRAATYTNLPGGSYRFLVRAANNHGVWTGEVRSIAVEVAPPFWKTVWFRVLIFVGGVLFIYGLIHFLLARQEAVYRQQALEAEQEILRLRNAHLQKEVVTKQERLSATLLQTAHKNEVLTQLKDRIRKMPLPAEEGRPRALREILGEIDRELQQEDYWEQFQLSFDQMHQSFIDQLHALHPNLTQNDFRLCCFIRMQLTNREIAGILNITINGVEKSKYRLKKKIGLEKEDDLHGYLQALT